MRLSLTCERALIIILRWKGAEVKGAIEGAKRIIIAWIRDDTEILKNAFANHRGNCFQSRH